MTTPISITFEGCTSDEAAVLRDGIERGPDAIAKLEKIRRITAESIEHGLHTPASRAVLQSILALTRPA